MTHSMTAFARVQTQSDTTLVCWEIKAVNHRYLEASFRMPESVRFLETNLRDCLRGKVSRGKIESQLKLTRLGDSSASLTLNQRLIKNLLTVSEQLAEDFSLANDLTTSNILAWPGILEENDDSIEQLKPLIESSFQQAICELLSARLNEGEALKRFVKSRLDLLKQELQSVRAMTEEMRQETQEKLLTKLRHLPLSVNDNRLEQEIALLLTRLDVSEELDRLQSHMDEVQKALETNKPVGRRLDFLMQELNREANTLSSKSDSAKLTQHAVEMKVLIEQMREQIQNIE